MNDDEIEVFYDSHQDYSSIPMKWRHLKRLFEKNAWVVDRISGSHFIMVKNGYRPVPLAFHGESLNRTYAKLVLEQAGILGGEETLTIDDEDEDDDNAIEEKSEEDDSPQDISKSPRITAIPMSKELTSTSVEEEAALLQQAQLQQQLTDAEKERQKDAIKTIQEVAAKGDYSRALALIAKEEKIFSSTSLENQEFVSDLIFFRVTSQAELALNATFGSAEQRDAIIDTLELCTSLLKRNVDKRRELCELVVSLQRRMVDLYTRKAARAIGKFVSHMEDEKSRREDLTGADDQADMALECFVFIVEMHKLFETQPFSSKLSTDMINKLPMCLMISVCAPRVLLLFEMQKFEAVQKVVSALLFVLTRYREQVFPKEFSLSVQRGEFPKHLFWDADTIVGISEFLQCISPTYSLAKDNMKWQMLSGVAEQNREDIFDVILKRLDHFECSTTDALAFTDGIFRAIEKVEKLLDKILENCVARQFLLNTWLDSVCAVCFSLQSTTKGLNPENRCPTAKEINLFLRDCKRRGYNCDSLKRNTIMVLDRLQRLTSIYERFAASNTDDFFDLQIHKVARFQVVGRAREDLSLLMGHLFDQNIGNWALLHVYVVSLQRELDSTRGTMIGNDFIPRDVSLKIGQCHFCERFITAAPLFLFHHLNEHEQKKILVLDGLGVGCLRRDFTLMAEFLYPESLSFSLVKELLKLDGEPVSEASVRKGMEKYVRQYVVESKTFRRDFKNRVKKTTKQLVRLSAGALDQRDKLEGVLFSRDACVTKLMSTLETIVLRTRRIPRTDLATIGAVADAWECSRIVSQYPDCIPDLSYQDLAEISLATTALQDAAEEATGFLHRFTSQRFPMIKSISNPNWSQEGFDCGRFPLTIDQMHAKEELYIGLCTLRDDSTS